MQKAKGSVRKLLLLQRETILCATDPDLDRVHGGASDPTHCGLGTCVGTCNPPK